MVYFAFTAKVSFPLGVACTLVKLRRAGFFSTPFLGGRASYTLLVISRRAISSADRDREFCDADAGAGALLDVRTAACFSTAAAASLFILRRGCASPRCWPAPRPYGQL